MSLASKDDLVALRLSLQRQQREINEKLKAIQLIESMLTGSVVGSAQISEGVVPTLESPQRYNEVKLRDACKDVLATVGNWYSTNKITQAVTAGGFPFKGNTPMASVSTILRRMEASKEIERKKVGRENLWRLKPH